MATEYATDSATDPTTGKVCRNAGAMQAYALRQLAFDLAREFGLSSDAELTDQLRTRANAVTGLVRAWAEADERARIARGRPLPGSLRPERKTKRKQTAVEPVTAPITAPVEQPVTTVELRTKESL